MAQRYNDNTIRPKPQDTQLGVLKIDNCCRKISRVPRVQETTLLGLGICL